MSDNYVWRPIEEKIQCPDGLTIESDEIGITIGRDNTALMTAQWPEGYAVCQHVPAEPQAVAPQPDWSQAPEWAQWWAMDEDGKAYWFSEQPILGNHHWRLDGISGQWLINDVCTSIPDWRQTLHQRP